MTTVEKRKYPRLALNIEEGYFGNFKLDSEESFVASIVNLSAGGLNMSVPNGDCEKFKEGDQLLLNHIAGGANLSFLSKIKAEVRWIKPSNRAGYSSVGCHLKEMADEARQQLLKFVATERMTRGQYD